MAEEQRVQAGTGGDACRWPMRLDGLEIGKDAVVASVDSDDPALHQHILDMGLTPGTEVTMMKHAPMGDPLEIRLRDYELTLRRADAARIELRDVHDAHDAPRRNAETGPTEHPALGEERSARARRAPWSRRDVPSPSRSPATRTAARRRSSTSSPAPTSMSATSPAYRGPQGRQDQGASRGYRHRPARHLLASPYTSEEVVSRRFILSRIPTR